MRRLVLASVLGFAFGFAFGYAVTTLILWLVGA